MTMTWFKLHHDVINDPKLRRFSVQEKWSWIVLLCLASQSEERGVIRIDEEDLADICEFNSVQDWLYYKDKLKTKGMIDLLESGAIAIINWEKRQYSKPSQAPEAVRERVAKHRAKKKAEQVTQSVTPCNTPVTTCNDTDSDSDSDSDPDPDPDPDPKSDTLIPSTNSSQNEETDNVLPASHSPIAQMEARFRRKGKQYPWKTGNGINDFDKGFVDYLVIWLQGMGGSKRCGDAIAYLQNHQSPRNNLDPDPDGIGEGLGKILAHWKEYQKSLEMRRQSQATAQYALSADDIDELRKQQLTKP